MSMEDKNFWKGKKVLVTGHSGFKGGWLTLILNNLGAKVCGISSESLNNNKQFFDALQINSHCHSFDVDIRESEAVKNIANEFKPDILFHLAAQPLVRLSYENPVDTYDINVMGTLSILELVRSCESIKASVFITTDKCYENKEWSWGYRENDPMGGHDPYSSSKGCAELLIQSYQKSFFSSPNSTQALSSARAGNVIGGGDFSPDRLVPDIVEAIIKGKKVKIRNPLATRPWQHVFEPLHGYMMVAEDLFNKGPVANSSWNFGPHLTDIRTVNELAQIFFDKWGIENIIEYDTSNHPHEAKALSLDISKAHDQLKWLPRWGLEKSLENIADWYKAFHLESDLYKISIDQINSYFKATTN